MTALWDIRGKYHDAPVYELLGGKQRSKLRTYASQLQFGWGIPAYNRDGGLQRMKTLAKPRWTKATRQSRSTSSSSVSTAPTNYLETTGFLSARKS